jgi:peptidoglycan/xylan/chitin deacetylase (PgdA/CDA1 family)
MTVEELREAQQDGFAIELHTHTHSLRDFGSEAVREEIELNRKALAAALDRSPDSFRHFCYQSGLCSPAVRTVFKQLGIASSTTLESALARSGCDPLFLPRIIDGEHLTAIEFEAQLSGISEFLRTLRASARRQHKLAAFFAAHGKQSSAFR